MKILKTSKILTSSTIFTLFHTRRNRTHVQIEWALHFKKLLHEIHFSTEYMMSYNAFTRPCFILRPFLERKHAKSRGKEQIKVEIIVACGLRYLAGGKASDQKHIFGLSRTEVYRFIWNFVAAVNKSPDLNIVLPESAKEWVNVHSGFGRKKAITNYSMVVWEPWMDSSNPRKRRQRKSVLEMLPNTIQVITRVTA